MRQRILRYALPAVLLSLMVLLSARTAEPVGVLSSGTVTPIEQRLALAVGPDRSTLWTQLRFETRSGEVALIVPAPEGASLDWSSPAWFEALELATAPRVLAPDGTECPLHPEAARLHVTGQTEHVEPLPPAEVAVLADSGEVESWAGARGLSVSATVSAALDGLAGWHFVAVRYEPPSGTEVLTATLRVVLPQPSAVLPLVLAEAGSEDLLITAWSIGPGRAAFAGLPATSVDTAGLIFNAAEGTSSYDEARDEALAGGGVLLQSGSDQSLAAPIEIPEAEGAAIPPVVATYFERAALYGEDGIDPACTATVRSSLGAAETVAESCPAAALGVVAGAADCTETVNPDELDPAELRCAGADELAIALSGQVPADVWLTRHSLLIPAGGSGAEVAVSFSSSIVRAPTLTAGAVYSKGCRSHRIPVYEVDRGGCSCDGEISPVLYYIEIADDDYYYDEPPDAYYYEEDCEGDATDPYESDTYDEEYGFEDGEGEDGSGYETYEGSDEDCGGDTADTSDTASGEETSGCEGDSSDTSDTGSSDDGCGSDSSDTSDDDCGGDSSDTSDEDCSGGSGGSDGSSSGDWFSDDDAPVTGQGGGYSSSGDRSQAARATGNKCTLSSRRHIRRPKLSQLLFGTVFILVPLRRLSRRRRRRPGP